MGFSEPLGTASPGILLTHHLFLSFSLGGWKLLFDIRNKALKENRERGVAGQRSYVTTGRLLGGGVVPQTSWGEGRTWEAAARPARSP